MAELETFHDRLINRMEKSDSSLCVGLDTYYPWIPPGFQKKSHYSSIISYNRLVIDQTYDLAAAYKINVMLYLAIGETGIEALRRTVRMIRAADKTIPIIADTKVGEMGTGIEALWQLYFESLGFDAIIQTPWFGSDSFAAFKRHPEVGSFVYVHDSNPSAPDIQQLTLQSGRQLYEEIAHLVVHNWNIAGNICVEAAATFPVQLQRVRQIVGEDMPILTAGIGTQGGKLEDLVGCFGNNGHRLLVNSSRAILQPENVRSTYQKSIRQAATKLRDVLRLTAQQTRKDI